MMIMMIIIYLIFENLLFQRDASLFFLASLETAGHRLTQNNRQIENQLDREEEEEATDRCIQHILIDRKLDREEEEEATDRCIQHRTIDREEGEVGADRCIQYRTIDRERDNIEQQIDRVEFIAQNIRKIE